MVVIAVRGRDNYWRYTLYSWLLEVKDILEYELGEHFEITVLDGESEDPELLVDGELVGRGIPGEEGYLIEILKKALAARGHSGRTTR
ncbi:MAG: hypothetical protein LM556_02415 [Desulfurococcaceae archaeon]|nr:hypothetical protein [Desulfurococcaceae archaeon]